MIRQRYIQKSLVLLCLLMSAAELWAQTVKNITVSQGKSYTDHVSLSEDTKDMDLMVKFIFNENTNTLNVCLISYRDLFVFPTDTPFKQAFKGKNIKPDKLPFVVNSEPDTRYVLSKEYKKSLSKPNKKIVFHQWVSASGMQPLPVEYKMVNDYVSQDFSINNKAEAVSVTVRDVMMMEKDTPEKPKKYTKYNVVWGKDLNTTYHISIERNPCFGMEEEIASAQKALDGITNGYNNLKERFGSGIVSSRENLANFKEMKELLVGQYPRITEMSDCPDIHKKQEEYNKTLDSIQHMKCYVRTAYGAGGGRGGSGKGGGIRPTGEGVDAGFILTQARQIDETVAQWIVSRDKAQRNDLKAKCQQIIKTVKAAVTQKGIRGEAQRRAVNHFNEAIRYYRSTCL